MTNTKANVLNVPAYAANYPYWVATPVDGEYWFFGAYDDKEEAINVAMANGIDVIYD